MPAQHRAETAEPDGCDPWPLRPGRVPRRLPGSCVDRGPYRDRLLLPRFPVHSHGLAVPLCETPCQRRSGRLRAHTLWQPAVTSVRLPPCHLLWRWRRHIPCGRVFPLPSQTAYRQCHVVNPQTPDPVSVRCGTQLSLRQIFPPSKGSQRTCHAGWPGLAAIACSAAWPRTLCRSRRNARSNRPGCSMRRRTWDQAEWLARTSELRVPTGAVRQATCLPATLPSCDFCFVPAPCSWLEWPGLDVLCWNC